jgi:phosphoribosylglycinamide formyltransferase 1
MQKIAILASHNGSGLSAIAEAIAAGTLALEIALIISNNTQAGVLQKAVALGVPHFVVNATTASNPDETIASLLQEHGCELVFLSGYMKKISPSLTQNFRIINSHPALLPKFGGAGMYGRFVHEAVVAAKEQESGVTIHEVNENYDEGKIILQKRLSLAVDETPQSLEEKIKLLEKESIVEALALCLN